VTIRNDPERTLIPSPARHPKESRRKLPPMPGNPQQAMVKSRARAETSLIPDQLESHRSRPGANAAGFFASRTYRGVAMFDNISSRVHPAGGRRKLPPEPGKPRKIMSEMPCVRVIGLRAGVLQLCRRIAYHLHTRSRSTLWNGFGTQRRRPTATDSEMNRAEVLARRLVVTNGDQRQAVPPNCHAGGRGFESRRSRLSVPAAS
jgi:hypothetical protein